MKKGLVLIILSFFLISFQKVKPINIEDIEKILKDIVRLAIDLGDSQTGLIAQIDKLTKDTVKLKAFLNCSTYAAKYKKPFSQLPAIRTKYGEVRCTDYSIPLETIQLILTFINQKLIGTPTEPGIIQIILNILRTVNLKGIEKVTNTIDQINNVISSINKLLADLEKNLKVKDEKIGS